MKTFKLKQHFGLELNGEVVFGPRLVELDERRALLEAHKIEDAPEQKPAPEKKKKEK